MTEKMSQQHGLDNNSSATIEICRVIRYDDQRQLTRRRCRQGTQSSYFSFSATHILFTLLLVSTTINNVSSLVVPTNDTKHNDNLINTLVEPQHPPLPHSRNSLQQYPYQKNVFEPTISRKLSRRLFIEEIIEFFTGTANDNGSSTSTTTTTGTTGTQSKYDGSTTTSSSNEGGTTISNPVVFRPDDSGVSMQQINGNPTDDDDDRQSLLDDALLICPEDTIESIYHCDDPEDREGNSYIPCNSTSCAWIMEPYTNITGKPDYCNDVDLSLYQPGDVAPNELEPCVLWELSYGILEYLMERDDDIIIDESAIEVSLFPLQTTEPTNGMTDFPSPSPTILMKTTTRPTTGPTNKPSKIVTTAPTLRVEEESENDGPPTYNITSSQIIEIPFEPISVMYFFNSSSSLPVVKFNLTRFEKHTAQHILQEVKSTTSILRASDLIYNVTNLTITQSELLDSENVKMNNDYRRLHVNNNGERVLQNTIQKMFVIEGVIIASRSIRATTDSMTELEETIDEIVRNSFESKKAVNDYVSLLQTSNDAALQRVINVVYLPDSYSDDGLADVDDAISEGNQDNDTTASSSTRNKREPLMKFGDFTDPIMIAVCVGSGIISIGIILFLCMCCRKSRLNKRRKMERTVHPKKEDARNVQTSPTDSSKSNSAQHARKINKVLDNKNVIFIDARKNNMLSENKKRNVSFKDVRDKEDNILGDVTDSSTDVKFGDVEEGIGIRQIYINKRSSVGSVSPSIDKHNDINSVYSYIESNTLGSLLEDESYSLKNVRYDHCDNISPAREETVGEWSVADGEVSVLSIETNDEHDGITTNRNKNLVMQEKRYQQSTGYIHKYRVNSNAKELDDDDIMTKNDEATAAWSLPGVSARNTKSISKVVHTTHQRESNNARTSTKNVNRNSVLDEDIVQEIEAKKNNISSKPKINDTQFHRDSNGVATSGCVVYPSPTYLQEVRESDKATSKIEPPGTMLVNNETRQRHNTDLTNDGNDTITTAASCLFAENDDDDQNSRLDDESLSQNLVLMDFVKKQQTTETCNDETPKQITVPNPRAVHRDLVHSKARRLVSVDSVSAGETDDDMSEVTGLPMTMMDSHSDSKYVPNHEEMIINSSSPEPPPLLNFSEMVQTPDSFRLTQTTSDDGGIMNIQTDTTCLNDISPLRDVDLSHRDLEQSLAGSSFSTQKKLDIDFNKLVHDDSKTLEANQSEHNRTETTVVSSIESTSTLDHSASGGGGAVKSIAPDLAHLLLPVVTDADSMELLDEESKGNDASDISDDDNDEQEEEEEVIRATVAEHRITATASWAFGSVRQKARKSTFSRINIGSNLGSVDEASNTKVLNDNDPITCHRKLSSMDLDDSSLSPSLERTGKGGNKNDCDVSESDIQSVDDDQRSLFSFQSKQQQQCSNILIDKNNFDRRFYSDNDDDDDDRTNYLQHGSQVLTNEERKQLGLHMKKPTVQVPVGQSLYKGTTCTDDDDETDDDENMNGILPTKYVYPILTTTTTKVSSNTQNNQIFVSGTPNRTNISDDDDSTYDV